MAQNKQYTVIRDTKEKENFGWTFEPNERCLGTISQNLKTGDYTLLNMEDIFTIERKRNTGEIYKNLTEKRFYNELDRFSGFKHTFIICEFPFANIINFPNDSNIPKSRRDLLKLDGKFMLKKLTEISIKYNTNIIYADKYGAQAAQSIFKRMIELYG